MKNTSKILIIVLFMLFCLCFLLAACDVGSSTQKGTDANSPDETLVAVTHTYEIVQYVSEDNLSLSLPEFQTYDNDKSFTAFRSAYLSEDRITPQLSVKYDSIFFKTYNVSVITVKTADESERPYFASLTQNADTGERIFTVGTHRLEAEEKKQSCWIVLVTTRKEESSVSAGKVAFLPAEILDEEAYHALYPLKHPESNGWVDKLYLASGELSDPAQLFVSDFQETHGIALQDGNPQIMIYLDESFATLSQFDSFIQENEIDGYTLVFFDTPRYIVATVTSEAELERIALLAQVVKIEIGLRVVSA